MADHADVPFRDPQLPSDVAGRSLRIERQEDDHAIAFGEPREARLETIEVEQQLSGAGPRNSRISAHPQGRSD